VGQISPDASANGEIFPHCLLLSCESQTLKIAPGLLQKAVFHASHSGPNGAALLLIVPTRAKVIAVILSEQSVAAS
jgi:hypothetical protein